MRDDEVAVGGEACGHGWSEPEASRPLLNDLVDTIVKSVKKGESVKIPGLGIFRLRKMKARIGRNPQTGEAIKIPARKKAGFSVAKTFKESVLGKSQVIGRRELP